MRRLSKVKIAWSPQFAYAIGLITSDGNLSIDNRHINFTSKDRDLAILYKKCLGIKNKIGRKGSGQYKAKKYYVVQFGDKNFYEFLLAIGLMQAKSKKLKALKIPSKYFLDFFRGCIDGDGNINVFHHPESRHPQLRLRLCSASFHFLNWIQNRLKMILGIRRGWIDEKNKAHELNYGKADSEKLLKYIYYDENSPRLERKYLLARPFLGSIIKLIQALGFTPPSYNDIR